MIKFKAVRNTDDKIIGFTVKGHSEMAHCGSDIVCAAVSTAVWMAINGIEKQHLAKISYKQSDGFVDCTVGDLRDDGADAVLESLIYIIEELSAKYKKYIFMTLEKRC